jgi:hypothetical protein
MNNIIKAIDGKKTYITSVILSLYSTLKVFDVINTTPEQDWSIYGLIGALFAVSLKSALKKTEPKNEINN